eukprot:IDg888t1
MISDGASSVYAIIIKRKNNPRFDEAKLKEIDQLLKRGTKEDQLFKARLVILGHVDPDKPRVVNEAPTVLKSSIRLSATIIASYKFKYKWSRDITQAFAQSDTPLQRKVYVRPPKGEKLLLERIGVPSGSLLHAVKPGYGLPESPGYWWQTFKKWHEDDLGMKPTSLDPCLFYKVVNSVLEGVEVTQVDDTFGGGKESFSKLEEMKSSRFECHPRSEKLPIKFNGFWIDKHESGGFIMHQKDFATKIEEMSNEKDFKDFTSLRGKL